MFIADTPNKIEYFRMLSRKGALQLELVGMKRRGRSAYSIIKEEYNLKGSREKVLEQFCELINAYKKEILS